MTPTNHPLTETRAAELWDSMPRSVVAFEWEDMNAEEMGHALAAMRAAYDADREHEREHEREHADHDPRPWQYCTVKDICKGDLVEVRRKDLLHVGVAHRQDVDGDWWTKDGYLLTYGGNWPLRRIPAPNPPAEEVELPTEHPTHITDVENAVGDTCAYMALDRDGDWVGVDQDGDGRNWVPGVITAFTLPDGTRARRDGDRFIKVQEEEK